ARNRKTTSPRCAVRFDRRKPRDRRRRRQGSPDSRFVNGGAKRLKFAKTMQEYEGGIPRETTNHPAGCFGAAGGSPLRQPFGNPGPGGGGCPHPDRRSHGQRGT